ncbi:ATP-binding protein [Streptomyces sp. NPDC005969]|uniref:ATP-binding protein n=1 Tax=Streptomyces sp. NPDC005969 TaxID=3156722 RepID=UPI0033CD72B2
MTTHLAGQERTCRSAPVTANELRSHTGTRPALAVSIERRRDPDRGGLSGADAAWPQRLRRIVRASLTHWGHPNLIETSELLLTELATNALRHAGGLDVGVRVYLQGDRLVIEVNDGSPVCPELRHAELDDEGGRGLLLVKSMADAWGVSPDGTTTWCSLSLTEGPTTMERAAAPPLVSRETRLLLPADPSALKLARINGRTLLMWLSWHGNQHAAIDVLYVLVNNAFTHALSPGETRQGPEVWLRVTEAHDLIIDVTDLDPEFPNFGQAVAGELGHGLWGAQRLGAAITWFPANGGKTVRATMRPGPVPA